MKLSYVVLKGMPFEGGIEKFTEEIGSRLVLKGHKIVVYSINHYQNTTCFYKGMKIVSVPAIKTKSLEKMSAAMIATLLSLSRDNADVVHIHAFGPGMLSIVSRIMNKKVVVQGHGLEWMRSRWGIIGKWFLKLAEWPSVKFPNKVTVVSRVQQRYLREKYHVDSVFIPTGINPPLIEKPNLIRQLGLNGRDYILFCARLVKEKGAHYLIDAYNKLKPSLKLIIAGDSSYEDSYKAELKRLSGNNKNIIFTGFVRGKLLSELLSNCYVFVLPSDVEGLSTALLEAMSYGNCCLVSDIPENLEALNGFGYTFKRKDINDLADKLDFLIGNVSYVNRVKSQAKNFVLKNYSWDLIASKMEALYLRLLEE